MQLNKPSGILLLSLMLFSSSCEGPSKNTEDTMNNALPSIVSSSDTLQELIYGDFAEHIVIIKVNELYGLYDTLENKAITQVIYENIGSFANEHTIDFKSDDKYGYLNSEGTIIVEPAYNFTTGFHDGLAGVKLNEKWGYVDKQGNVAIPVEYELAWSFKNAMAAVKKDGKWGFINLTGDYVIDPVYDDVTLDFDDSTGVANVSLDGQHFYINQKGKRLKDSEPYKRFTEK